MSGDLRSAGGAMWHDVGWTEDAAAYAVGALDDAEQVAYEAHLAECGACRSDVRAYRDVIPALAASASPPDAPAPSPALRERIVAAARAAAAREAAARELAAAASEVAPSATRRPAERLRPPAYAAPRRGAPPGAWGARLPWLAAAASAALAAGLGLGWAQEREVRLAERERSVRGLQALAADVTRRTARLDSAIGVARDSTFVSGIVQDVRAARLPLPGGPPGPGRAAWLIVDAARGVAVLSAANMPRPHPGQTYQLWAMRQGEPPANVGVFAPDARGGLRVVLRVPHPQTIQAASVTEEPDGGSLQPTAPPLTTGELGGAQGPPGSPRLDPLTPLARSPAARSDSSPPARRAGATARPAPAPSHHRAPPPGGGARDPGARVRRHHPRPPHRARA